MKILDRYSQNPKWLDSRLFKPPVVFYDRYQVVFKVGDLSPSVGIAGFSPIADYTDGRWTNVTFSNENPVGDAEVLYWTQHMSIKLVSPIEESS